MGIGLGREVTQNVREAAGNVQRGCKGVTSLLPAVGGFCIDYPGTCNLGGGGAAYQAESVQAAVTVRSSHCCSLCGVVSVWMLLWVLSTGSCLQLGMIAECSEYRGSSWRSLLCSLQGSRTIQAGRQLKLALRSCISIKV